MMIYKLRNNLTGQFVSSCTYRYVSHTRGYEFKITYSDAGKTWNKKDSMSETFENIIRHHPYWINNLEIVEFEVKEVSVYTPLTTIKKVNREGVLQKIDPQEVAKYRLMDKVTETVMPKVSKKLKPSELRCAVQQEVAQHIDRLEAIAEKVEDVKHTINEWL